MSCDAVIARSRRKGLEFVVRRSDRFEWIVAERDADTFVSMRDATRAALTLPSGLRAFALPLVTHAGEA
jgi:hypothetical protein